MDRSLSKGFLLVVLAGALTFSGIAYTETPQGEAQNQKDQQPTPKQAAKDQQRKNRDLERELDSQYKKWLNEDVTYIITSEEKGAFLHLSTNEEREQFIEQFWQRS